MTAFGQTISNDSIKCFSYEQVRQITKDIKKGKVDAKIIKAQELQIMGLNALSLINDTIITKNNKRLLELTDERNKARKKLKASINLTKYGLPISFGFGFIVAYLVVK